MRFAAAVVFAASASSLVSARLEQVRRHGSSSDSHLAARSPNPEPFRLFPAPGASGNEVPVLAAVAPVHHDDRIALRERGGVSDAELEALLAPVHPFAAVHEPAPLNRRSHGKCHRRRPKQTDAASSSSSSAAAKTSDSAAGQQTAQTHAAVQTTQRKTYKSQDSQNGSDQQSQPSSTSSSSSAQSSSNESQTSSSNDSGSSKSSDKSPQLNKVFDGSKGKGLIGFSSNNCGPSGATDENPNGSESFLTCGISKNDPSSGWQVPEGVTLDNIKTVSLEEALASNSVWEPCKQFVPLFEKYGKQLGLPPILLAAFALQESTCNANIAGDSGGAFGLMQITQDKCGGRDAQGCSEPDYNIRAGAEYFKKELDKAGGVLLKALGQYNGWYPSMTYSDATAAAYGSCCVCQQNLDYLFQMLDGWLLGRTGYERGSFKNLAVCH
ncbi:hypothetical protein JCM8202_006080 [Rhodotorula sphaerocarpa]